MTTLAEALAAAGFKPPFNVCAACKHDGGKHDLNNRCLICGDRFSEMTGDEQWAFGLAALPPGWCGHEAELAKLMLDIHVEGLREEVARLTRERDLAVAHDRQPYPTAWAYEQACRTIERLREQVRMLGPVAEMALTPDGLHRLIDGYCPDCGGGCLKGFGAEPVRHVGPSPFLRAALDAAPAPGEVSVTPDGHLFWRYAADPAEDGPA